MKKRDSRRRKLGRGRKAGYTSRRRAARRRRKTFDIKVVFRNLKNYAKQIDWSIFPKIGRWIFEIAIVILLACVFVLYFGQRVSVVGDSMKPVLENGDVVLVNRIVYNTSRPKRGDVIVFKPKGNENSHYYIKRIVGLPGEKISIIENAVYIDGEKFEESYETTDIDNVGVVSEEITLGSDEYFVLGDDRENSEDSRSADVGNVKYSYIYGKAWYTCSPRERMGVIRRK